MKAIVEITPEGAVRLDKALMEHLGLHPGDRLFVETAAAERLEPRPAGRKGSIEDFIGCLANKAERPISIEEMNEAIERGWAGEL